MVKSAFIINSPFQALCSIEAKAHYGISKAVFFLFDTTICHNMVEPLLRKEGEICYVTHSHSGTIKLMQNVRQSVTERFSLVFCGDYFSYAIYVVALCISSCKAQFIYLDDGNSTLEIIPPISRKRPSSKNESYWYRVLNIYAKLKSIKSSLFSIYNLGNNCPLPVTHNRFTSLVSDSNSVKRGVFVIGTNASKLVFREKTYAEYLSAANKWIMKNYEGAEIYYCPHRGDKNDWSKFVRSMNWSVFNTQISVEIDFVKERIYPMVVIGFGSTALLTLKMIYPKAEVLTIVADYANDLDNQTYREIEDYYRIYDIIIITV